MDESELYIPSVNVGYSLEDNTAVQFRNRNIVFPSAVLTIKAMIPEGAFRRITSPHFQWVNRIKCTN